MIYISNMAGRYVAFIILFVPHLHDSSQPLSDADLGVRLSPANAWTILTCRQEMTLDNFQYYLDTLNVQFYHSTTQSDERRDIIDRKMQAQTWINKLVNASVGPGRLESSNSPDSSGSSPPSHTHIMVRLSPDSAGTVLTCLQDMTVANFLHYLETRNAQFHRSTQQSEERDSIDTELEAQTLLHTLINISGAAVDNTRGRPNSPGIPERSNSLGSQHIQPAHPAPPSLGPDSALTSADSTPTATPGLGAGHH